MSDLGVEKDSSIRDVVARLRAHFGADVFVIVDNWDADLCAIGIAARDEPGRLAYIATYEKPADRFFLSLELPAAIGSELPYEPAGEWDGLTFAELTSRVAIHLRLQPIRPAG